MKVYAPKALEASDYDGINRALQTDGVAVIKDILSENEQNAFLDYFWEAVNKRVEGLRRDDPSTWTPEVTDWYGTFGAGQYKHYGMAQEKHCWLIRENKTIKRIFEEGIFASQEGVPEPCCVSLDGCAALFRPVTSRLEMHVDQVPGLEGYDWGTVQGAYNLFEVKQDENSAMSSSGFVCVVGSHRLYNDMWERRRKDKNFVWPTRHWHKLEPDSPLQEEGRLVLSPPNSLVLWRSDLLHKNYGGDFEPHELGGNPRLPRLTQFVSFAPKKYRSPDVLEKKAQSVIEGRCNNHWAALSVEVPVVPVMSAKSGLTNVKSISPMDDLRSTLTEGKTYFDLLPENIQNLI